jgi:hypothetical protein
VASSGKVSRAGRGESLLQKTVVAHEVRRSRYLARRKRWRSRQVSDRRKLNCTWENVVGLEVVDRAGLWTRLGGWRGQFGYLGSLASSKTG